MHQTPWSPERSLPPPVSLTSQSHHEKPPEVTCTSRGKPGFPASTRERPRETFFNTSRGQVPLPGLESNDALPLATRMETRLPWRPTRGSLTSPSYLDEPLAAPPAGRGPSVCSACTSCFHADPGRRAQVIHAHEPSVTGWGNRGRA